MEAAIQIVDLENPRVKKVVGDILSQSITGELIGMSNFASLAETIDDYSEKMEAVEHAESERQHAIGFISIADQYNLPKVINVNGTYWNSIRQRFLHYARSGDFIACLIIQEVMLESFAVSMYRDTGRAIGGDIGDLLLRTSAEEMDHLEHCTEILQNELAASPEAFTAKFHQLHDEVMTILCEFSANSDHREHCGVCNGNCMKDDLMEIGLTTSQLRGNALRLYAEALDRIGIPSEQSTIWMLNLPA
ncbi:MAG: long-chain fatty aldehyde decarbonylase [Chryseolinea sp.]